MAKSLILSYILWLIGGPLGLHHLYLGRDRHALVWMFTLGGCFGLGWVRDFICLPEYVNDANDNRVYLEELRHRMRMDLSPPFHTLRLIGEIIVGLLFGLVIRSAIPESVITYHRYLDLLVPIAVAIGVHLVGNIGRQKVSLKMALLGSFLGFPFFINDPSNLTYMGLISAITVNVKGKSWRLEMPDRHICKRLGVVSLCVLVYTSLWCSTLYHNAYVSTADGERVKLSEAMGNFFKSPAWADTKETMWRLWGEFLEKGPRGFYEEFVIAMDPEGELHAHRVLGVSSAASEKEITSAYRRLVREWHPDKQKDKARKKEASEKFMEIQQAYETLSHIKNRRSQQNRRQRSRDEEL